MTTAPAKRTKSATTYGAYVGEVREQAIASFRKSLGARSLAPVVVVIAALNEEDCIGAVLDTVPSEACSLPIEVLVVDDGSVDGTARIAEEHGVNVVRLERNCGHGIALRVGYQLARAHGARFIVTLDADGQWGTDPDELARLLEPLVEDEADFVLGSRILGRAETDDVFRHAGVRFFAALVRLLTGVPVTDTSTGFRAMRAEVTGAVRQDQVQYQSSELLIGAIYGGYRVAERPVVAHKRIAGESKKGHNFLYGLRYARVVLATWWRERRGGTVRLAEPRPRARESHARQGENRVAREAPPEAEPHRSRFAPLLAAAREHKLFLALLVLGGAVRLASWAVWQPALVRTDSVSYLVNSQKLAPNELHPAGYPVFLRLLPVDQALWIVPAIQHVLMTLVAVGLYALLLRLGTIKWLAALATAGLLLDAYLLNLEQYVLSETLFLVLLAGGTFLLLCRRPRGLAAAGGIGLLFAAAALTRPVGLVLILPAALVVFLAAGSLPVRARLLRVCALAGVFGACILGYMAWFHSHHGVFGVTTSGGRLLYGRVVSFAECKGLDLPDYERPLCVSGGRGDRPEANKLIWFRDYSPIFDLQVPPDMARNEVVGDFSRRVIRARPLEYARVVTADILQSFWPSKRVDFDDIPVRRWEFPLKYFAPAPAHRWADARLSAFPKSYVLKEVEPDLAGGIRIYQRYAYAPGTLLGLCLLVGLAAAAGAGRIRRPDLRLPAFAFAILGVSLLVAGAMTTIFNWRYQLPQLLFFPPAAALGLTAWFGARLEPGED